MLVCRRPRVVRVDPTIRIEYRAAGIEVETVDPSAELCVQRLEVRTGECPYPNAVVIDRGAKLSSQGVYPAGRLEQLVLSRLPLVDLGGKEAMGRLSPSTCELWV